jgi:hypothetical protein
MGGAQKDSDFSTMARAKENSHDRRMTGVVEFSLPET